jgi:hypothetical protein
LYQPLWQGEPPQLTVLSGAVVSIWMSCVLTASGLPALS